MKKIIWKDIFKPRYAVLFEVERFPTPPKEKGWKWEDRFYAVVRRRPYKRPLHVPFNVFYGELSRFGTLVAGHYWVLRMLYGIGSTNRANMKNPIVFEPNEHVGTFYPRRNKGQ